MKTLHNARRGLLTLCACSACVGFLSTEILFEVSVFHSSPILFSSAVASEGWRLLLTTFSTSMCLIAAFLANNRLRARDVVMLAAGVAVLCLSSGRSGEERLLRMLLMVFCASLVDSRLIIRLCTLTVVAETALIVMLSLFDIIPNIDIIPNRRLVFCFGMAHPNILSYTINSVFAMVLYMTSHSRRWYIWTLLGLPIACFAYVTLSAHASTVIAIALMAGSILTHTKLKQSILVRKPIVKAGFLLLLVACMLLMLIGTVAYDSNNAILSFANRMTHSRLSYANQYYQQLGKLSVWGDAYISTDSYHNGVPFASVDSAYCRFLLSYGIIPMAVLTVLYGMSIDRVLDDEDGVFIALVFVLNALLALTARAPVFISTNLSLLLFSKAFFQCDYSKAIG